MYKVVKRDQSVVDFQMAKVAAAMQSAFTAVGVETHPDVIDLLALRVTADFQPKVRDHQISVEDIQDSVESVLSQAGYANVSKAYILYRRQREKLRNVGSTLLNYKELVDNYLRINDWRVKENSTVTYSVGGLILSNSGAITANYWLSEIYDAEIAQAHRNAELHLHDLAPEEALRTLVGFTVDYQLANPDFIRLVMNENIHRGEFISRSPTIQELNIPVIHAVRDVYQRGVAAGVFRPDVDPVDLHRSISALSFFNVSNQHTFGAIFKRPLDTPAATAQRRDSIIEMVVRFLRP